MAIVLPSGFYVSNEAAYAAPDEPKKRVSAKALLPTLALTKAERIARKYTNRRGGKR